MARLSPPRTPAISSRLPEPRTRLHGPGQTIIWDSPAFLKRVSLPPAQLLFTDEELELADHWAEGRPAKRTKFGRTSGQWRFVERSPSPEKSVLPEAIDLFEERRPVDDVAALPDATSVEIIFPEPEFNGDPKFIGDPELNGDTEMLSPPSAAPVATGEEFVAEAGSSSIQQAKPTSESSAEDQQDGYNTRSTHDNQEDQGLHVDRGQVEMAVNDLAIGQGVEFLAAPLVETEGYAEEQLKEDSDSVKKGQHEHDDVTTNAHENRIEDVLILDAHKSEPLVTDAQDELKDPRKESDEKEEEPLAIESDEKEEEPLAIDSDVDIVESHKIPSHEQHLEGRETVATETSLGSGNTTTEHISEEDVESIASEHESDLDGYDVTDASVLGERDEEATDNSNRPIAAIETDNDNEHIESEGSQPPERSGRYATRSRSASSSEPSFDGDGLDQSELRRSVPGMESHAGLEEEESEKDGGEDDDGKDDGILDIIEGDYRRTDPAGSESDEERAIESKPQNDLNDVEPTTAHSTSVLTSASSIMSETSSRDSDYDVNDATRTVATSTVFDRSRLLSPELSGIQEQISSSPNDTSVAEKPALFLTADEQLATPQATQLLDEQLAEPEASNDAQIYGLTEETLERSSAPFELWRRKSEVECLVQDELSDSIAPHKEKIVGEETLNTAENDIVEQTEDLVKQENALSKSREDTVVEKLDTSYEDETIRADADEVNVQSLDGALDEDLTEQTSLLGTEDDSTWNGFRTPLSYFSSLASLEQHFSSKVDVLAVAISSTKPARAKGGPRHMHQTIHIVDRSSQATSGSFTVAQLFRPLQNALPQVQSGDAVLLRDFKVQTQKRKMMLVSTDSSAWAVFRFNQEPQTQGPPVEIGKEEEDFAEDLLEWWSNREGARKTRAGTSSTSPEETRSKSRRRSRVALSPDDRHVLRDGTTYIDGDKNDDHELRDGRTYTDK